MKTRSLLSVPFGLKAVLLVCLSLQITWNAHQPKPEAKPEELALPPPLLHFRLSSLGEPVASAQLTTLYLQAFDNQPGISIPFRNLDYTQVETWLARILELDPLTQYPLLMASQLYAQVPDEAKQRQMLAFTHRHFLADPNRRWPWLAHAAIVAKHRLHDLPLALLFAQDIAAKATGENVPHWARQMQIFILEDMGEAKSAKILLGGLLASGTLNDSHEIHFLTQKMQMLEAKITSDDISSNIRH